MDVDDELFGDPDDDLHVSVSVHYLNRFRELRCKPSRLIEEGTTHRLLELQERLFNHEMQAMSDRRDRVIGIAMVGFTALTLLMVAVFGLVLFL